MFANLFPTSTSLTEKLKTHNIYMLSQEGERSVRGCVRETPPPFFSNHFLPQRIRVIFVDYAFSILFQVCDVMSCYSTTLIVVLCYSTSLIVCQG